MNDTTVERVGKRLGKISIYSGKEKEVGKIREVIFEMEEERSEGRRVADLEARLAAARLQQLQARETDRKLRKQLGRQRCDEYFARSRQEKEVRKATSTIRWSTGPKCPRCGTVGTCNPDDCVYKNSN
ncbi:hypothetical protein QAD02_002089 [Eretmocerus hayati]|uniref:Uncharacterized protein n=1 Tax=Eretmocerus hayati TaxID=131215 RepID=A0ACC2NMQ1_9HYME|nr:hypothetical protein QAD02_002089 [Eretmocerus hayati]